MNGKKFYKKWVPIGARWVEWVRPVPFIAMNDEIQTSMIFNFCIPKVNYLAEVSADTAVFVDVPSYEGVEEGLALAKLGFRPIPLYNGTKEPEEAMALINTQGIESALRWGALQLEKIAISNDAPPAFLLDSNRMHRHKMNSSVFDNSWDLYHQDIPSAEYFLTQGIDKIVVHGEKVQRDLSTIFYKFQVKGMTIFITNGFEKPKAVVIKKNRRTDD